MSQAYRAIEATNTKTRRLAYLSAIVTSLRNDALTERMLLEKMNLWGKENRTFLKDYWVSTGEVTSTPKNSAGMVYIELAQKLGLITTIAGTFRSTRVGLILYYLLRGDGIRRNPFFLKNEEKIFYTYLFFQEDADIFLTIVEQIQNSNTASLSELQHDFYHNFLQRLEKKISFIENDMYKRQLLERRNFIATQWKKPERYSEHIVPPRLNWMLDLDLLDVGLFIKHKYTFSEKGVWVFPSMPRQKNYIDVTQEWLDATFWEACAHSFVDSEKIVYWKNTDDTLRSSFVENILSDIFSHFQNSQIPRVSFKQAVIYMTILLITKKQLVASPKEIQDWFSTARIIQNRKYEIRMSPRENESYLLASFI